MDMEDEEPIITVRIFGVEDRQLVSSIDFKEGISARDREKALVWFLHLAESIKQNFLETSKTAASLGDVVPPAAEQAESGGGR
jgi:hypothetical protein